MGCTKYRCPDCGSTDIVFAEESVIEKRFKLKKDGKPFKKPYETVEYCSDIVIESLECQHCHSYCRLDDKSELKKWENAESQNSTNNN